MAVNDLFGKEHREGDTFKKPVPWSIQDGEARKKAGMSLAAGANARNLARAREIAVQIASRHSLRECEAESVGKMLQDEGIAPGPWMGSLFKGGCWEFTGQRIKSSLVTNHARELKVWRLK